MTDAPPPALQGLRVLAFEQYGAGPFGTQYLADLGAEVIKIETPASGDYARDLGPYFLDGPDIDPTSRSLFFQAFNRNKKSLTLNLKHPDSRDVLARLVASADATANNFRGDVPAKLGLTYDALKAFNPKIVCAHCSAYGRTGSRRSWPGFDFLMQAEAGYFYMTGDPDGPPARMGLSVVDYMAGQSMALGLVSGVLSARGTAPGQGVGRDVDVNLFETALFNLAYTASWALNADFAPQRLPRSAHPSLVPCQLYRTADGWIYLMLNKASFWPLLCQLIDAEGLAADVRFLDFAGRLTHRDLLTQLLDELLMHRSTADWMTDFAGKIPAAPVLSASDALTNPFLGELGAIETLDGDLRVLRQPIQDGSSLASTSAPALGAETEALLTTLGFTASEIEDLTSRGVV